MPTEAPALRFTGIAELLAAQASGSASAVQITTATLLAIGADGANAVVAVDEEAALHAADEIDRARSAGEPLGPLAGVPVTVKDCFAVAGLPMSDGTPETVHVASFDAPAVARMRAAGAIVIGKTNLAEALGDAQSDNPVHGRTLNPHDPERTPGGSSGGSAAAVAAGLSWGDLGGDLAGSIRVPAAWCGVVGHRPSNGIVSKRGHLPWPTDALIDPTASAAGPIARRADDARRLLDVLVGAADADDRLWRVALPAARVDALAGLRVGVWTEPTLLPVDDEQQDLIEDLASALAEEGARLTAVTGSPLATRDAAALYDRLVAHELAFPGGGGATVGAAWSDWNTQRALRDAWESSLGDLDVLIAPAVPHTAPRHSPTPLDPAIGGWSRAVNLGMGPATIAPLGLGVDALPIAVQVVGRYGDDLTTLKVVELLEAVGIAGAPTPASTATAS